MSRTSTQSTMYQDFVSRRPMEVEVFLGSPIKMAKTASISAPQLQTLYPLLCHLNAANQTKAPTPNQPNAIRERPPPPGPESAPSAQVNGPKPPPPSTPSLEQAPSNPRPPAGMKNHYPSKRPPSSVNGRNVPHGNPERGQAIPNGTYGSRRNSFDNDLEEFGHIVMYGDMLHTDDTDDLVLTSNDERNYTQHENNHRQHLSIRERELQLKQRELALKEQELALQRNARALWNVKG
ncbi:hypothetical protein ABW21_db0203536 [Orbilia brochopaga]|nr:hypothetical protein ABW21_db0203536 [Drechslerella brochopaga]